MTSLTTLQNITGIVKAFGSIGFGIVDMDGRRSCFGSVKSTRHRRRMWNFRFQCITGFTLLLATDPRKSTYVQTSDVMGLQIIIINNNVMDNNNSMHKL